MATLSGHWTRYWSMWCISPSDNRKRYQNKDITSAKAFCTQALSEQKGEKAKALSPTSQPRDIQHALLSLFKNTDSPQEHRAHAGLCLRCYVSDPILKACQKIDSLFSGNKAFSYQDLLPFVLNDDGQSLVILDDDYKSQRVIAGSNRRQSSSFKIFSVEVLRTYKDGLSSSMSLDNWAFLRTKQHPELKKFLSEFGFQSFSDWTLLNRIQENQKERLTGADRLIVEAFHAVYRRDRRAQKQFSRCKDPTAKQLAEMNTYLHTKDLHFGSSSELFKALKQIAAQLRAFDIWNAREPLEIKDVETGSYRLRADLPADTTDELEIEEQDFLSFLEQQLAIALTTAIEQAVQNQITRLKKSKKYSPFAASYRLGLQRYYKEGISLKDIGPQLGTSSWDQTRRILNPGELLSGVRRLMAQQLLAPILHKAQEKDLVSTPAEPSYLKMLMEQIEDFLDRKLFTEAISETKAGKNRSLNSAYAQALIHYLDCSTQ